MIKKVELNKLAAIEYHGADGVTQHCLDAIVRLIQFGDRIEKAWLLSGEADQWNCRHHAFILSINYGDLVAIKSGFASGYGGEGPGGLSKALQLLIRHKAEIEEHEIKPAVMERLTYGALLSSDIDFIKSSRPIRPNRFRDYIFHNDERTTEVFRDRDLNYLFPPVVPLATLDARIMDLALNLEEHPDASLLSGYRRLEGLVRNKHPELAGLSAAKLFSKAYQSDNALLEWADVEKSEADGRASLFIGVFKSYRNKRAHHEQKNDLKNAVREFILLNELFLLESTSIVRDSS
ncbi:MAG: TIGR02391 family protein [Methylophaga sp.]